MGAGEAAARTIFRWNYSLEKSSPLRNSSGASALGGAPETRSARFIAPCCGPRGQARSLKFETQMENCYLKPQQAASPRI